MIDDPIYRFTLLTLHLAQQDKASELAVLPLGHVGPPIRYKVGGTWYDVSPPPPEVVTGFRGELQRLAGCLRKSFPKEGTIDVPFSGTRLRWRLNIEREEAEYVLTPILQ
jgi:hypothetical protein